MHHERSIKLPNKALELTGASRRQLTAMALVRQPKLANDSR